MADVRFDAETIGEIIEIGLSDPVSFAHIRAAQGVGPDEGKVLVRRSLKPGRCKA